MIEKLDGIEEGLEYLSSKYEEQLSNTNNMIADNKNLVRGNKQLSTKIRQLYMRTWKLKKLRETN